MSLAERRRLERGRLRQKRRDPGYLARERAANKLRMRLVRARRRSRAARLFSPTRIAGHEASR